MNTKINSPFKDYTFPVAFVYAGKQYYGFGCSFEKLLQNCVEEKDRIVKEYKYFHTPSKTEWTVRTVFYPQNGAFEWQANVTATEDTEVFSGMRYAFTLEGQKGKVLGNYGDAGGCYGEYEEDLTQKETYFESVDGRATHGGFPYCRVETDSSKQFVVLSWQGTWSAKFTQTEEGVCVDMGQKDVSTKLYKGETFRLPMGLWMPYEDDPINCWRKFFIQCNMAKVDGERVKPISAIFNGQCDHLSEEIIRKVKNKYVENNFDYDMWWFDAGIGTDGTGPRNEGKNWWHGVNVEINYEDFPDGLDAFGRELANDGKKLLMWFEPEVVRTKPELMDGFYNYHPEFKKEWFIGLYQYDWCDTVLSAHLLDLGNDECRTWLENKIFEVMDTTHANVYRQDFNIPPASVWKQADKADRQGMTENKYCQGYLTFLQDIQNRYPGILMDSCASGGGRLDLETMRMMFPLHYSDHQDVFPADAETKLYMTQIISRWFPYYKNHIGAPTLENDYTRRSCFGPMLLCGSLTHLLDELNFTEINKVVKEWRVFNRAYFGNYYELEKPTKSKEDLKAYMLYDEEETFGFAILCAPSEYKGEHYVVRYKGLQVEQMYSVKDVDTGEIRKASGESLMKEGFIIDLAKNQSRLYTIEKI